MNKEHREHSQPRPPLLELEWATRVVGSDGVHELEIHFGDLYVACGDVMQKIERIGAWTESVDPQVVRRTLAQLEAQLYEHILPHLQRLKPPLNVLTSRLYAESDEGMP